MMGQDNWLEHRLSELGEFRNGVNFTKDQKNSVEAQAFALINVKDIIHSGRCIQFEKLDKVDLAGVKNVERYAVENNDLYFIRSSVKRDGIGWVSMAKRACPDAVHCGFVIRFRLTSSKVLPLFLTYQLRSPLYRQMIINLSSGAAIINISQDVLGTLQVKFPVRSVQQRIINVISAYDDLIENNTRRIRILEEMAQTIYREWFVHFRFPGHQKVRMVDSPLGKIPQGWEVGKLQDALLLQRGFDLPIGQRRSGSVPIYASTGVTGYHDEVRAKGPGVVTGRSGSLGAVLYVASDYWPLNTTLWVKEFRKVSPVFAYYLLKSLDLAGFNSGAAVPTLNRNDVHGLPVVIPPTSMINSFNDMEQTLFDQMLILKKKNDTLRQTRDLLLPKLISGEVDVSELDIENGVAAA